MMLPFFSLGTNASMKWKLHKIFFTDENQSVWIGAERQNDMWIQTQGTTFSITSNNWKSNKPYQQSLVIAKRTLSYGGKFKFDDVLDPTNKWNFICQYQSYP